MKHPLRTLTRCIWPRDVRARLYLTIHIKFSLCQTRRTWFISRSNNPLATVPLPSGMVGRFLKPQIRAQHERLGFVTACDHVKRPLGLELLMSQWPNSTRAQDSVETTRLRVTPAPAGTSGARKENALPTSALCAIRAKRAGDHVASSHQLIARIRTEEDKERDGFFAIRGN